MKTTAINNSEQLIINWNIIDRIKDLEEYFTDTVGAENEIWAYDDGQFACYENGEDGYPLIWDLDCDLIDEYNALKEIEDQCLKEGAWHEFSIIREDCIVEYVRDSRVIRVGSMPIDFDGVTYYIAGL